MAHQPLKRSDVFPRAPLSDADWEDLLLRAVFEAWGINMASDPDIKLSCARAGSGLDDSGTEFAMVITGVKRQGDQVDFYRPRFDTGGLSFERC